MICFALIALHHQICALCCCWDILTYSTNIDTNPGRSPNP